jgi:hypothetical protein
MLRYLLCLLIAVLAIAIIVHLVPGSDNSCTAPAYFMHGGSPANIECQHQTLLI